MTMDAETIDGVLAYMAYRIVDNRRRALAESVALSILRDTGEVTVAQVQARVDAEWIEPAAQEIKDIVARKAQAAIDYHLGERPVAERQVEVLSGKLEKAKAEVASLEEALAAAQASTEVDEIDARQADARAIFEAAVAAGGDPGRAPQQNDAAAAAQVADVVGEATRNGG